jgi:hypothetical protein
MASRQKTRMQRMKKMRTTRRMHIAELVDSA